MRLIADNLVGERGGEIIFSALSFEIKKSEALIITGPNGSGKSTLLRIIAGLLTPAEGEIKLTEGGDTLPVSAACHYLGHHNAMKPGLTVRENLLFWQQFHGADALPIDEALEAIDLAGVEHLPFGYLSTGQKRRISIAKLLVSHRPIWIVDEPTAGLDKASEMRFARLMHQHMQQGGMILAATHIPLGLDAAHSSNGELLPVIRTLDMGDYFPETF